MPKLSIPVNCGNVVVDIISGNIVTDAKNAIPLTVGTAIRKIKPAMRFKRKVGPFWIASQQLSMEYLMAAYMLRNNVKKVAGFYQLSDGRFSVFEFTYTPSPASISSTFSFLRESPQTYIEIEDKHYEVIFGNTELTNSNINFAKLLKESSLDKKNIAVLAIGVVVILLSAYVIYKLLAPEKHHTVEQKSTVPPPLTEKEREILQYMALVKMVKSFNSVVNSMSDDTFLESASLSIQQNNDVATGTVSLKYRSYYPYPGSSLIKADNVELYEWSKSLTVDAGRQDINPINYIDPMICLKTAITDGWEIIGREDNDRWKIRLLTENYEDFVRKYNKLAGCKILLGSMSMSKRESRCELTLISSRD